MCSKAQSLELDPEITNLKSVLASNRVDQWLSAEEALPVERGLETSGRAGGADKDQEGPLSSCEREPGPNRQDRNCPALAKTFKYLLGIQTGTESVTD